MYVAVQVVCSPGASVETGQETVPTLASLTPTEVSVTLPVFVTTNVYAMVEPTTFPLGAAACLSSDRLGRAVTVVSVVSEAFTALPDGGFAETVARFATCPASTSACVSVYEAVQVVLAPVPATSPGSSRRRPSGR